MCMGFYHVVPTDSETIRHLKQVHAQSLTIKRGNLREVCTLSVLGILTCDKAIATNFLRIEICDARLKTVISQDYLLDFFPLTGQKFDSLTGNGLENRVKWTPSAMNL